MVVGGPAEFTELNFVGENPGVAAIAIVELGVISWMESVCFKWEFRGNESKPELLLLLLIFRNADDRSDDPTAFRDDKEIL